MSERPKMRNSVAKQKIIIFGYHVLDYGIISFGCCFEVRFSRGKIARGRKKEGKKRFLLCPKVLL